MARSRTRKPNTSQAFDLLRLDQILSKTQLITLIAAIVIVPVVVLPESNFVDITSNPKSTILRMLGTFQAGILLSRLLLAFTSTEQNRFSNSIRTIRSNRPALLVLSSVTAVTIISLISAIFSILPAQSWWGRVPAGLESGEYTFLMYVTLSVSTFISLREFGEGQWLWKSLTVAAFIAGFIGFFQFLGWSPLDVSTTHRVRLTGTNGNPIFFGAMLVVIAPVAIGYLIFRYRRAVTPNQKLWLAAIGTASFVLSLSLVGTASRGPWVGAFAGGVTTVTMLAIYGRTRLNLTPIAVATLFIALGALSITFIDPTPPEKTVTNDTNSSAVSSTLAGVSRTNTLDLRIRYWKLSAEMAVDRAPVPYTNDAPKIVRLLFGYGPDMFRFAGTYFSDNTTFTRRLTAAHNDPINRLVEQGLLGLLAWVGLWLSIAYGCFTLVRKSGSTLSSPSTWLAIAISTGFASRFAEQLFGSPTPGGVLVFWILVAALAAMIMNLNTEDKRKPIARSSSPVALYASYAGVLMILIASITLAWDRGANYLIANQMASFQYRSTVVPADEAIKRLEQVTALAPDVPRYWNDLAEIEHGRAAATENPQLKAEALLQAYEYDRKGYQANPMEVSSIYQLAFSAWEAGEVGDPELRQEAVKLYERLIEIIPSDELAKERLEILNDYLAR